MPVEMRGIYLPEFGLQIEISSINGGRWQLVGARSISGGTEKSEPRGSVIVRAYARDETAATAKASTTAKRSAARRRKRSPGSRRST